MALQRESFERWGVMGAWDAPYHTMQPKYEAAELGVLRTLLKQDLIYRGRRPVHWSPATRALARSDLTARARGLRAPRPALAFRDATLMSAELSPLSLGLARRNPYDR